jgi:hypothetical protein
MHPSTKLRLYNITSKAELKYDSEVEVLNKGEYQQLEAAEMKFLRSLLGLPALDHQRNTTIREKLKVEHVVNGIQNYQKNWLQQVKRTVHSRIPRMVLAYQPKGERDIDRPKIRWRDQLHLRD